MVTARRVRWLPPLSTVLSVVVAVSPLACPSIALLAAGCASSLPGMQVDAGESTVTPCAGKDVFSDPTNCGGCGIICSFPNAPGTECNDGKCEILACADGYFDVDGDNADGCECAADAMETRASSECAGALALGSLHEAKGTMLTAEGNLAPVGDEDWWAVEAVDDPEMDGGCDQFHLKIQLADNPGDQYRFDVLADDCASRVACAAAEGPVGVTSYEFDANGAAGGGQCPCVNPPTETGAAQAHMCHDDSRKVRIRVWRTTAGKPRCDGYKLLVTNG